MRQRTAEGQLPCAEADTEDADLVALEVVPSGAGCIRVMEVTINRADSGVLRAGGGASTGRPSKDRV